MLLTRNIVCDTIVHFLKLLVVSIIDLIFHVLLIYEYLFLYIETHLLISEVSTTLEDMRQRIVDT